MVVQNYDVQTTSQRTYLAIKSSTTLATNNLDAPTSNSPLSTYKDAEKNNSKADDDEVELSSGKDKKPNNGLSLGHFKDLHKEIQDESIMQLGKSAGLGSSRISYSKLHDKYGRKMPTNPEELKLHMMSLMFELVMGSSKSSVTKLFNTENGSYAMNSVSESFSYNMSLFANMFGISEAGNAARTGWKVESFEYESEQVSYQAQGVVNTADGRSINFDVSMYMSRQFSTYMGFDVEVTRSLCDPLVINYAGTAASLTGDTFSFDLTSDGNMEMLASLGQGSGFLALDKNGDGIINNGSELFGPNSGCGFSELREHDADFNGWIDEADEVFDKLLVWSRDKDGNETSYTLKELGIGAIYLGDIATEFSFKDENNGTLGVMRSTSFFLKEDGSGAGTISHIDLAV